MKCGYEVMLRTTLFALILAVPMPADRVAELRDLVASGRLPDLRRPDFSDYKIRVQSLYAPSDYALAWTVDGVPTEAAKSILEALRNADSKGLDAQEYGASRLTDLAYTDAVRFDLGLTVSLMRYISDLHFGRVNPGIFHASFDLEGEPDLTSFIRRRLIDATNAKEVLDSIEPPYEGYRRTQQALQHYLNLAHGDPQVLLPSTKNPIEPGSRYPAAAQLASLLRRLGDLPPDVTLPSDPNLYSGPLVDAVKRFQVRHGLDPDGRIGPATLRELNTPLSQRVRQLQLTLERWRWAPHSFPRPPILVNIPEFQLRALDSAYHTELEMKVVVGKAFGHQTPVFTADMKSVVFRPYWEVPFSIQSAELVPKIEQDRSYLAKNRFEVVTAHNEFVSSGVADDGILERLRSGELRIRQIPGPENSLGLVKFLFPNPYDVYLHGTPATELFFRTRRDFSHGCIRVEKPVDLAEWVLRDQPSWTREGIEEAMRGSKTIHVELQHPIPVLIVYATAVVLANGEVRFFDDIYGLDAQIERLLAQR